MAANVDKEACVIGAKLTIRGQVTGQQDLVLAGRIEGRVVLGQRLTIEEGGSLKAEVEVAEAAIKGVAEGDIIATRAVTMHARSRTTGTVRAPRVAIEAGAYFSGTIDMDVELPPDVLVGGA